MHICEHLGLPITFRGGEHRQLGSPSDAGSLVNARMTRTSTNPAPVSAATISAGSQNRRTQPFSSVSTNLPSTNRS
jgi:hypothetical protein